MGIAAEMANQGDSSDAYRSLLGSFVPRRSLLEALDVSSQSNTPQRLGLRGGLFEPRPPTRPFGLLGDLRTTSPPAPTLGLLRGLAPDVVPAPVPTKRRSFFSFHYADVMPVNNVRNSGEFKSPSQTSGRGVEGFYDASLWESRKRAGPEAIKSLIRNGVHNTSAVCVLAGSETWSRRWVRYEIAQAIVDGRGLLTVHINGLRHHKLRVPHARGPNPLDYMAVGAVAHASNGPKYHLFEFRNGGWYRYEDYMSAVDLPRWLARPPQGYVRRLSTAAAEYDYVAQSGYQNIGPWIDAAAAQAFR